MKRGLIIGLLIFVLLVGSFISIGVIADDSGDDGGDVINQGDSVGVVDDLSDNTEDVEVEDVVDSEEVEIIEEDEFEGEVEDEIEDDGVFGVRHVTVGEGFILNEDKSDAEFFRGIWIVKRFINGENIESKRFGNVVIGFGNEKEHFKLEIVNSSEEEVSFSILNRDKNIVGSLVLNPKRYDRVTLWFGDLVLDSGNFIGSWKVTAIAKSKVVKPKIRRPAAWKFWKFKEKREAKVKERDREKLFDGEGLGDFIRENRGDLRRVDREKRIIKIDRDKRIEKRREHFKNIKEKRDEFREKKRERIRKRDEVSGNVIK